MNPSMFAPVLSVQSFRSRWTSLCVRSLHSVGGKRPAGVYRDMVEAIGNTPMVRLRRASEETSCEIWGKCEFANPGGSVKDRPAREIVETAEREGKLKPGSIIVEGSAGNTAIGLALVGNTRGYRTVCVIPHTQSEEKKEWLRISGCQLVEVPPAKVWHPGHFVKWSGRLAEALGTNAFWARQFDNRDNRRAHYKTTGPEVWEQMDGKVDAFVSSIGTGGTIAGVAEYMREQNSNVKIVLADVPGAVLHRYYTEGVARAVGSSITENIGQGRVTENISDFSPDLSFEIPDEESLPWCFSLLKDEGLAMGFSSGVNVAGAVRTAKQLGPGHTIVTVLCDFGQRYAKKQYNSEFLHSVGLPSPPWMDGEGAGASQSGGGDQELHRKQRRELEEAVEASRASEEMIAEATEKFAPKGALPTDPNAKV